MTSKELLNIAINAAIDGGDEIMKVYNGDFEVFIKEDDSPLTIADQNANKVIVEKLDQTEIPVLSEEGKTIPYNERKNWKRLWIVDPLDGTKEFVKRNGEFTVNIALIEDGIPVMGVIYVPVKKVLYFAKLETGNFILPLAKNSLNPETNISLVNIIIAAITS